MSDIYVNAFKERLKKNRPEDNLALRDSVQDLTDHPGWKVVTDLLSAYSAELETYMEHKIHEHPVYAAIVRERRALRAPQAAVTAVLDRAAHDEEYLTQLVASEEMS